MANFLTRAPLSRRTFLRGAGVTLALPWLEAMAPRLALAGGTAAPAFPLRFAFVFIPNGARHDTWTPAADGPLDTLPPTLEPLAPFRERLLVLTGLAQKNAEALGDGPGDHARSAACFLTGSHPKKTEGADIHNGVSIDQKLAEQIGGATTLPSLEVGCEPPLTSGNCDSGYSCAYSANISWKGTTTPQLKETDPRLVFERLFGDGASAAQRIERLARRRSLLDYAQEDAQRLKVKVGATDRRKLDEYLDAIRTIELQIEKAQADAANPPTTPAEKPAGIPREFPDHARLLAELVALAFAADLTRVATHMLANDGNNKSFPWIEVPEGHHETSHHGNEPGKLANLVKIDRFHVELFGHLLAKLAATNEGDGTLLDHCLVLYGAGISDGNAHNHDHLPILLAGGGNGTVQSGRHLRIDPGAPLCNLYLELLDRAGARVQAFGDSNGRLPGLA